MTTDEAGRVLSALQLLNQLIHPDEDQPLLVKWRGEISQAIALQECEHARRQRQGSFQGVNGDAGK